MGKLVVISAPSGTGKSTIIGKLMSEAQELRLRFSISATSRPPRGEEQHGREYYFFSPEEFRAKISAGDFLEWEEVYDGKYYGTLKSEIERILDQGDNVIFDVDCIGGLNIKRFYGSSAMSLFIKPPSLEALRVRLKGRSTDSDQMIEERLAKAATELAYASDFDCQVVNDNLQDCYDEVYALLHRFLG